jgi:asparaginyl-tRNA synthetase
MAEAQKTIYIDEDNGIDAPTTNGSQDAPFKTLSIAYIQNDGQGSYLVKKWEEGKEAEWVPATKSGLKKATTALTAHKKKAAKEIELAERTKKEQEAREKTLEEAKKIVIKEDAGLPQPKKIRLDQEGVDIKLHKEGNEEKGTRVRVLGTNMSDVSRCGF